MKGLGGAGFLGLGNNTLRAFTAAPQIQAAVALAHRMARQRLESGGPADSPRKHAKVRPSAAAFMLPTDIDASAFAEALRAKLGNGDADDALYPLEQKKLGGRVVLRGRHVLRLGDGRFSEGRAYLHALVRDFRKRRWRALHCAATVSCRAFSTCRNRALAHRPLVGNATAGSFLRQRRFPAMFWHIMISHGFGAFNLLQ